MKITIFEKFSTYSHGGVFELNGFVVVYKAIFMHDPIGLDTLWGSSFVEHQSLLDTNVLLGSSTLQ